MRHSVTLDILRGVAAVMIVLFHFTCAYNDNSFNTGIYTTHWGWSVWWGYAAVATFFMLSGFLAARYLLQSTDSTPQKFFINKMKRFYPSYWLAMTITAVVLCLFWKEESPTFIGWLANLTMVSRLFGVPFVDGAYWYMQCELMLCIITAFLMLVRSERVLLRVILAWILLAVLLSFTEEVKALRVFRIISVSEYCHSYIAGLILFMGLRNHRFSLLMLLILALCAVNSVLWSGVLSPLTTFFVVTSVVILIVKRLDSVIPENNPVVRCVVWIAGISYPLYLLHEMVGFTIIRYMQVAGMTPPVMILVPIAVCVVLAYMITKIIQKVRL